MIAWSIKLSRFNIKYQLSGQNKVQVLSNFVVELPLIVLKSMNSTSYGFYVLIDPLILKEAKLESF